jgi:hypothetical protein
LCQPNRHKISMWTRWMGGRMVRTGWKTASSAIPAHPAIVSIETFNSSIFYIPAPRIRAGVDSFLISFADAPGPAMTAPTLAAASLGVGVISKME